MTHKKLFLIIATLFTIVAIVLIGGYFYLTSTEQAPEIEVVSGSGSLAETQTGNTDSLSISETSNTLLTTGPIPKFRHITNTPVAGADFVSVPGGYVIWYVDRATGHISQTATSSLEVTRITNTTIPKVYEASIGAAGSSVILRTLNDSTGAIQTFIGSPRTRTGTTTDQTKELVGIFTSDIISFTSIAPTKDKFFGITGVTAGIGNIYTFAARSTNVFTHPLKKWIPQWVNASTILLTSAPSAKTENVSFFLNPVTKGFTKVMGPKTGLVASASPDASHILFSENKANTLTLGVHDVKTGAEINISSPTIPDKCVWSKRDVSLVYCGFPQNTTGVFPDDWYQGKVRFNDTLRTIDVNTLQLTTIVDLETESRTQIDAVDLRLSSDEKYLLFTNKNDLTLWMLEL